MRDKSTVDIRICDSEVVVAPSLKAINRCRDAGRIASEVGGVLNQPRERMLTDLVVDMGEVTSITSAGLNQLIRLQALSRSSGLSLQFRGVNAAVRDVFRMTRLERIFDLDNSAEEASSSVADGEPVLG